MWLMVVPFLNHKLKQKFLMEREKEGNTNKIEQERTTRIIDFWEIKSQQMDFLPIWTSFFI
jgi:hypothetical protein